MHSVVPVNCKHAFRTTSFLKISVLQLLWFLKKNLKLSRVFSEDHHCPRKRSAPSAASWPAAPETRAAGAGHRPQQWLLNREGRGEAAAALAAAPSSWRSHHGSERRRDIPDKSSTRLCPMETTEWDTQIII